MKKVILNGCFGGYGWSNRAIVEYLERKGRDMEFVRFAGYGKDPDGRNDYSKPEHLPISRELFLMQDDPSPAQYTSGCAVHVNGREFYGGRIERNDPVAIELLEERGSEYCSDSNASLYIDEYDDTLFDWAINEYDGSETLRLIPKLSEARIRACADVDEIVELLRSMNLFHDVALSGDD